MFRRRSVTEFSEKGERADSTVGKKNLGDYRSGPRHEDDLEVSLNILKGRVSFLLNKDPCEI